ncbi:unnamed protein product [Alopecurus aequalis]
MSSPAAVVGSSLARVVRPESRFRPYKAEQVEERSRLLSKIDAFYKEAHRRLSVDSMRDGLTRLYDTGVCVGLLDPVSNVVANALLISGSEPHHVRTGLVGTVDETRLREELAKRSLDGLIAFLVYFFPYLAGWEALRYLLVANADLLVAARLIVADRGMMQFSVTSPASVQAFKGAFGLAAQVAKHPDPESIVDFWMSHSSELENFLRFLSRMKNQTQAINLIPFRRLLDCPPDLRNAWDLAVSRPPYYSSIVNMPYQATRSLRMALLDTIRGFYLKALARLPRHELRTRYHRSLLRGGYCYGPLDPVSNIIVNTIWYDVMFPAAEQPVLDMIGPNSLTRLESRSFYGMASFLQTRYHNLSEHEVVQCLVASCGYLHYADRNLVAASAGDAHLSVANISLNDAATGGGEAEWQRENCRSRSPGIYDAVRKMEQQNPCTSIQEAYEAAATAAWHGNPEAQAVFLSSCMAMLQGPALSLLQIGDRLTSEDVQYITSLLSPKQKPTPERIEKFYDAVIVGKMRSEAQQRRVYKKVEAALGKHLQQDGEPIYELHIICSANESVCGPEYCSDDATYLSPTPCKFRYSHVNFLATRKGSQSDDRHPILFFAEFDNEEEEREPLLLCPVGVPTPFSEHVRCLYCEARGRKIVHPASEKLHGGGGEFDEVICGKRYLNNDLLIGQSEHAVQRMCAVEEDFMYVVDFKY